MDVQDRGHAGTAPDRQTCHVCGTAMRHEGKGDPARNGHHPTEFYCPSCDARRVRG